MISKTLKYDVREKHNILKGDITARTLRNDVTPICHSKCSVNLMFETLFGSSKGNQDYRSTKN